MEKENERNGPGLGFVLLLQVTFILLKLTGIVDWSWLAVLVPIWVTATFGIILSVAVITLSSIIERMDTEDGTRTQKDCECQSCESGTCAHKDCECQQCKRDACAHKDCKGQSVERRSRIQADHEQQSGADCAESSGTTDAVENKPAEGNHLECDVH